MIAYRVFLEERAFKSLKQIPNPFKENILKTLSGLETSGIDTRNIKKLKGYKDGYRLRVNNYRVLFVKNDETKTIKVYAIGHRRDVYKG